MSRSAVKKYNSSIKRALEMKQGDDIWIVMGKTSEWTDEDVPDTPSPSDDTLVEPFLAIKPIIKSMAKEITAEAYDLLQAGYKATVTVSGVVKYLELVADEDAYDDVAIYLYIQALYDPIASGHPDFDEFRVYYATSGLTPSAGYESDLWLASDNIDDYGMVEYENAGTKILGGSAMTLPALLTYR
jgi:hypothetical protein